MGKGTITKVCPNCEKENLDEAGFCQNCGEKLIESDNVPQKNKKSRSNVGLWWDKQTDRNKQLISIGGVIGIFLLIGIIVFMFNNTDINSNLPVAKQDITSNNVIVLNNSTGGFNGTYYTVKGTIFNNNSYPVNHVSLIIKTFDENGKLFIANTTYAHFDEKDRLALSPIPANKTGNFELKIKDPNKEIVSYDIIVGSANDATNGL